MNKDEKELVKYNHKKGVNYFFEGTPIKNDKKLFKNYE